jgi:hypothetical protein
MDCRAGDGAFFSVSSENGLFISASFDPRWQVILRKATPQILRRCRLLNFNIAWTVYITTVCFFAISADM